MTIDRTKLEESVKALSPLTLAQIERMFGPADETNKAAIWRLINMVSHQQLSIWQAHLRLRQDCPGVKVENVRCIATTPG